MKRLFITALVLGSIFTAATSCKDNKADNLVLTKEIKFTKEGELSILKAESDSLVTRLDIELAESEYETQTGLMYRKGMENNQGMLFIFENETRKSFYMKNTEFPLDIIFINANNTIVNIHKNTVPYSETSLPSGAPSKLVLEVNAGLSDVWGLAPGDKITFERIH